LENKIPKCRSKNRQSRSQNKTTRGEIICLIGLKVE
jgi:hypothetical protein